MTTEEVAGAEEAQAQDATRLNFLFDSNILKNLRMVAPKGEGLWWTVAPL